jgi:glyoxylase-like metal-dependent hydrolase (beta-lactamase superfamily II)
MRRGTRCALALVALVATRTVQAQSPLDAWNSGHAGEPVLTVRTLAPGSWVLRQSKRSNAEAPFIYLIVGSRRALLVDTGADPATGTTLPLREMVDSLLAVDATRRRGTPVPLLVMHSHGHRDHRALDAVFAARPNTVVVAGLPDSIKAALALPQWPEGEGRIDLGDRAITVLPTPGHEPAHLMYYDPATRTLLGGDMLYPGLLTVRDLPAFQASAARVQAFVHAHPVSQILGAHVEMTRTPRVMYPLGTVEQFDEHPLALQATIADTLVAALTTIGDFTVDDVHDDIILNRVRLLAPRPAPPSATRSPR